MKFSGNKDNTINKYAITYEPEVPDNSKVGRKLTSLAKDTLKEKFEQYFCWGNNLFSNMRITDDLIIPVEHDEQKYTVKLSWAKDFGESDQKEYYAFMSIFFKRLMGRLSFQRDGRNMFNPKKAKNIQNLEIWPGFFSSIQKLSSGALIQIDLANKVVRQDKLIDTIKELMSKGKSQE